jgi:glutamate-1-semialdehyde 2,1-aminomutase
MLQYYLRLHGLALSWVGTGRLIFSLNYSDSDFEAVLQKFVQAAQQMQQDGWWWHAPDMTDQSIRRSILKETLFR